MRLLLLQLAVACAARGQLAERRVSWWFDVGENSTVDAMNAATIQQHRAAFSRVMPYNAKVELDGNVSNWWGHDEDIKAWNAPLQALGVPVLPYLIDIDNSTQMHLAYVNSSKIVADAVAIAKHYGFQGWFIDYEDEYPPDTDPQKSAKLAAFLTELGDALHAENMLLTICVATWSKLLADFETLAGSSVDELQLMSTYARPSDYKSIISSYFDKVRAASSNGSTAKAGVGIGVYYDGRNGYNREWTAEEAEDFVQYVVEAGGRSLDIFRLLKDGTDQHDWPHDGFWWDVLTRFVNGSTPSPPPAPPTPAPPAPPSSGLYVGHLTHDEGYCTRCALSVNVTGGSSEWRWAWAHDSAGHTHVPEKERLGWRLHGDEVTAFGSSYYCFRGIRTAAPAGAPEGAPVVAFQGQLLNADNETCGSWNVTWEA